MSQKITTSLTYKDQAEGAATFYVSVFKRSKITDTMRAGDCVISVLQAMLKMKKIDIAALKRAAEDA